MTATSAVSVSTIAREIADDALKLASGLLSKVGALTGEVAGLVGKLAGVLGLVLNILATIATYAILQTQIYDLQKENRALREYVNAAFKHANDAMLTANRAGMIAIAATEKANLGIAKADFAIKETKIIAETLNRTTTLANATAVKADRAINDASIANRKGDQALSKADAALRLIMEAQNLLNSLDAGVRAVHADLINRLGIVFTTLLRLINEYGEENFYNNANNADRIYYLDQALAAAKRETAAALNLAKEALGKANQPIPFTPNTIPPAANNSNAALATAQQALNAANSANSKSDIALPTAISALTTAQQALNRPTQGATVTPSTGITSSQAELTAYINTTVNQSTGLRVEQVKVELQAGQQILKADLIRAINPTAIQAAGITAQEAKDEQLRQQPIIAGIQSTLAAIPASIDQVNQKVNQKVNQADLGQLLNNAIAQATTIGTSQIEDLRKSQASIIAPIQSAVASTTTIVGNLANQTRENLNLNQQGLIGIAGVAATLRAMPTTLANSPAVRNAAIDASKVGTCQASQPGACGGSGRGGFGGLTDSLDRKADALLQAGQGALLATINNTVNVMNTKLGALPLVGGISGALGGIITSAATDRVMNLVIMAGVVHNCMMLSNNIGETLFSCIDNIVAIPQLIKDPNGEAINSREVFTKYLDSYFTALFGATEWKAIKAQWKAYSTIYSSAAQGFDNVRNIANDTQELMNGARNLTAGLGNALLNEGIISEDNWEVQDEKVKIKSKGIGKLERIGRGLQIADDSLEAIEQVTSTLRNITETANEIKENVNAIDTAIKTANTAAKTDRDAKEEGLELPNFSLDNLF